MFHLNNEISINRYYLISIQEKRFRKLYSSILIAIDQRYYCIMLA